MPRKKEGWIGVDLDGTLAKYEGWQGEMHIGEPVPKMVERVRFWLDNGYTVKIMTARVCRPNSRAIVRRIQAWTMKHLGQALDVTNKKDYDMIELWDDRAVQIVQNTGERADGAAE